MEDLKEVIFRPMPLVRREEKNLQAERTANKDAQ